MADYSQPFIFEPPPGFGLNAYNEEANDREGGFGLGMALYDAPGIVTGGQQINLDLSQREVSPDVLIEAAKNPQWLLVALLAVLVWLTFKKGAHGGG